MRLRVLIEYAYFQTLEIIADRLNDLEPVLKETISTAVIIKASHNVAQSSRTSLIGYPLPILRKNPSTSFNAIDWSLRSSDRPWKSKTRRSRGVVERGKI
jgi:hypothetical protein